MSKKTYKMPEEMPTVAVGEAAVAYFPSPPQSSSPAFSKGEGTKWNPNVPFHATQEEWMEHIRSIEEGEFMTIEEADKEFELWKKEFLASRI